MRHTDNLLIGRLSLDLAQAEQYHDAYNKLIEEVDELVLKNALAEDEAARLSKFNAEIIGHNNPAQRISYVDRIRRELHETKQVRQVLECSLCFLVSFANDRNYSYTLETRMLSRPKMKNCNMNSRCTSRLLSLES